MIRWDAYRAKAKGAWAMAFFHIGEFERLHPPVIQVMFEAGLVPYHPIVGMFMTMVTLLPLPAIEAAEVDEAASA